MDCSNSQSFSLCGGSASRVRETNIIWTTLNRQFTMLSPGTPSKFSHFLNFECSSGDVNNFIAVSFSIVFENSTRYKTVDDYNEGVEFSIRLSSMPDIWFPIKFVYFNTEQANSDISIGNSSDLRIRGYSVQQVDASNGGLPSQTEVRVQVCGFSSTDLVQFRWLQTAQLNSVAQPDDVWILDDVKIRASVDRMPCEPALHETFSSTLDSATWPESHVRNAEISNYSNSRKGLLFGLQPMLDVNTVTSRALLTPQLNFSETSCIQPVTTAYTDTMTTNSASGNISDTEFLKSEENRVTATIMLNQQLQSILNASDIEQSLSMFENITIEDQVVASYLFASVVNRIINTSFSINDTERILNIGNNILQVKDSSFSRSTLTIQSTVFTYFDDLMFNYFPPNGTIASSNIALATREDNININQPQLTVIDGSYLNRNQSTVALSLPLELLQDFNKDSSTSVQTANAIYDVVDNSTSVFRTSGFASSFVISSSLQCGETSCPTSNHSLLSSNVTVTFEHLPSVVEALRKDTLQVDCVYLDISGQDNLLLRTGQWSQRGCTRNERLSSIMHTVCECDHLTHFAILLSPSQPSIPTSATLVLDIISVIGVTISLIAMSLAVVVFLYMNFTLKDKLPLKLHNFIHINLCVNLGISQIVFLAGADKTGPQDLPPPIHCQIVAILLQYFLLVTFMWMLMEGVALYIALIRVFDQHIRKYFVLFTLLSYGLPLLYMGLITLPLGYGLPIGPQYGSKTACFLNPVTHFNWSLTIPVLVIQLINIGFFIMAARISWKQNMKKDEKKQTINFLNWLRSAVSLLFILGVTNLMGIIVLDEEQLLRLAYIYTVLLAFQGFLIFLILVVFSPMAQDMGKKWMTKYVWKKKNSPKSVMAKNGHQRLNKCSTSTSQDVNLTSPGNTSKCF